MNHTERKAIIEWADGVGIELDGKPGETPGALYSRAEKQGWSSNAIRPKGSPTFFTVKLYAREVSRWAEEAYQPPPMT